MHVGKLISKRLEFLQEQTRLHPYAFYRDLEQAFGTRDARDLWEFRRTGIVRCDPHALFRSSGTSTERQALRRGLMKLEAAGVIQRVSRSDYRVTW